MQNFPVHSARTIYRIQFFFGTLVDSIQKKLYRPTKIQPETLSRFGDILQNTLTLTPSTGKGRQISASRIQDKVCSKMEND